MELIVDLTTLAAKWEETFHSPPISHLIRRSCHERWVRMYSLPEGKRYPENEAEYAELLARQNAIADAIFKNERNAMLITMNDPPPGAALWLSAKMDPCDADSPTCDFYIKPLVWVSGIIDPLLRLVADWQRVNVALWSVESSHIFCPYDGGVDIILGTKERRDEFKERFLDWVSPLNSGL